MACGIKVVPLGRSWSQLIYRSFLLGLAGLGGRSLANQFSGIVQQSREVGLSVCSKVGRDQIKDVAAVTGGSICPETRLLSVKDYLEAVTRTAQDIPDQELAASLLASGEQSRQHRFESIDQ